MDSAWASEHLQVIRTLMERSAVYRRALGPIMVLTGSIGVAAAAGGLALKIAEPRAFLEYWIGVSLIAGLGALLLVRRQAWKEREEFWSQPTRQVTQAMLPPMGAGLLLGLIVLYRLKSGNMELRSLPGTLWVPQAWVVLHGCALHALLTRSNRRATLS